MLDPVFLLRAVVCDNCSTHTIAEAEALDTVYPNAMTIHDNLQLLQSRYDAAAPLTGLESDYSTYRVRMFLHMTDIRRRAQRARNAICRPCTQPEIWNKAIVLWL